MNKLFGLIIPVALLTGCASLSELKVIPPKKVFYGTSFLILAKSLSENRWFLFFDSQPV